MAMRRDDLYRLIDGVPDEDVPLIRQLLGRFQAKVPTIPEDDEPWTEQDEGAFQEGMRDVEWGNVISASEAKRRLLG